MTVFGSARTEPGHWVYEEVKQMRLAPTCRVAPLRQATRALSDGELPGQFFRHRHVLQPHIVR